MIEENLSKRCWKRLLFMKLGSIGRWSSGQICQRTQRLSYQFGPSKRKRLPDGTISKYKARLCAHGGMQSWGVDYWKTFTPVVNWMSIRFLLTVAKIHGLDTKTIDFVLAFPQAELDTDKLWKSLLGWDWTAMLLRTKAGSTCWNSTNHCTDWNRLQQIGMRFSPKVSLIEDLSNPK